VNIPPTSGKEKGRLILLQDKGVEATHLTNLVELNPEDQAHLAPYQNQGQCPETKEIGEALPSQEIDITAITRTNVT
jgi:hypothetical protein